MKHSQPRGLSRRRVEQLLSVRRCDGSVGDRIEFFSRYFLGHKYQPNPLIGSADTSEAFVASLDGFDCVTYLETVLALARSSDADEFNEWLREIRYEDASIQWERRNHYMTNWLRNNIREGIVKPIKMPGVEVVSRERVLDVLPGLAAQRTRVKCVPKRAMARLAKYVQRSDLIFFASTRRHLDVFHTGIVVRDGKRMLMRHASRSRGEVVEQELCDFLRTNRMTGVIVVRPQEVKRHNIICEENEPGKRDPHIRRERVKRLAGM
jgi:hypothetical protein